MPARAKNLDQSWPMIWLPDIPKKTPGARLNSSRSTLAAQMLAKFRTLGWYAAKPLTLNPQPYTPTPPKSLSRIANQAPRLRGKTGLYHVIMSCMAVPFIGSCKKSPAYRTCCCTRISQEPSTATRKNSRRQRSSFSRPRSSKMR